MQDKEQDSFKERIRKRKKRSKPNLFLFPVWGWTWPASSAGPIHVDRLNHMTALQKSAVSIMYLWSMHFYIFFLFAILCVVKHLVGPNLMAILLHHETGPHLILFPAGIQRLRGSRRNSDCGLAVRAHLIYIYQRLYE